MSLDLCGIILCIYYYFLVEDAIHELDRIEISHICIVLRGRGAKAVTLNCSFIGLLRTSDHFGLPPSPLKCICVAVFIWWADLLINIIV